MLPQNSTNPSHAAAGPSNATRSGHCRARCSRWTALCAAVLAASGGATLAWAGDRGGGGGAGDAPIIPGEVTVRVADPAQLAQCVAALGSQFESVRAIDEVPGRNIHLLTYGLTGNQTTQDVETTIAALVANQTILWGELNYGAQTAEGKTDSLWVSQLTIGDEQYAEQYAFGLLGLDLAHTKSRGFGTVIAVLDTGIDASHPALAGRVLDGGLSLVGLLSPNVEVIDGIDSDNDGNPAEMHGHGTFVAGLISAVAPDAKLLSVRVLDDDGYGDLFRITKGMFWAIDQGVDVINMSLGSTYKGQGAEDAALEAEMKGIAVVAAAGNQNIEKPREYPACDNHVVGVASTDWIDLKAPFSNYNDRLALSAPGDTLIFGSGLADPTKAIVSTTPGGGYAFWEGTSLSTAFVSGTIALVRAQHPEWPTPTVPSAQIVPTMLATIGATSAPLDGDNPNYEGLLGVGRIDAGAAVLVGPPQPKPGDINLDGSVDSADLAVLLGAWGPCQNCLADIDQDGAITATDLSLLLGAWGS
jgi:subtilisin family serine protease